MKELFAEILNISISAGILIVVCVLVRLAFKNMPKFMRCLMWLLVAIRLAVPFSIESPFSLLPAKEYIMLSSESGMSQVAENSIEEYSVKDIDESATYEYETENAPDRSVNPKEAAMAVFSIIWAVGVIAVLTNAMISYVRLRKLVDDAVILTDRIYQSERISTAFVLGIISPKIYVPYGLSLSELYMSVNHEKAHIARRDHWVKPLGFILVAVYWFNPLVWLAYILLCRDIELACDEKVIKKIGYDKKKEYSQALLNLSAQKKYISACPVAFGEVGINERIKNVLKMKKGKKIIIAIAAIICGLLAICFLTYPRSGQKKENSVQTAEKTSEEVTAEKISEEVTAEADTTNAENNIAEENAEKVSDVNVSGLEEDASEEEKPIEEVRLVLPDGAEVGENVELNVVFLSPDNDGEKISAKYVNTDSKYVYVTSNDKDGKCVYVYSSDEDPHFEFTDKDGNVINHNLKFVDTDGNEVNPIVVKDE